VKKGKKKKQKMALRFRNEGGHLFPVEHLTPSATATERNVAKKERRG